MPGKVLAKRLSAAVDAASDGAQLDAQRGADLLVGQTLDVAQHDGGTELGGQRVERGLQVGTQSRIVVDLLGVRLIGRDTLVVLGQRLHPDAPAPADHVEEQVGRDAVQPAFEGAGLVVLHGAEHPDEGLLREIFCVVLVTRQAVGQPVDAVGVLADELVPARHGGLVAGGVEHGRAGQLVGGLHPLGLGELFQMGHGHRGSNGGVGGRRILQVVRTVLRLVPLGRDNAAQRHILPAVGDRVAVRGVCHANTFSRRGEPGI